MFKFHVNDECLFLCMQTEMIQPAVIGTQNVLNACLKAKVKRAVMVSSCGAVMLNPAWPKDRLIDEECWTDTEFCLSIKVSYITTFVII